ncbi:3-phosphoshikimate 1-carboxyvinyltransferase [Ilyomonas limi]|uniref:3-phosphoshikimate 1-carboxyvinyltransferase n=1 Tax=Ilyomonas limi TaxID=2575867 RepID=A0A4U3KTT6_9BACT|nr:3-phosphoshikimate 1-carboxyvinyltransferase [Ilyomonas limi]TKK64924.1 3-phosphoshikimate 1-carboxyvinyltransferase [Ilyomonas limi]
MTSNSYTQPQHQDTYSGNGGSVTIQPSSVSGEICAPASKSSMQRACAASLVRKGESIIHNPGISNDDKAALRVIQALGATVNQQDGALKITSKGINPVSNKVNCGESGLGIRMFAPLVAMSRQPMTIVGEGSLLTRPMDFFDEVLPQLGVQIASNNGKLPIQLQGPLQPKDITIDGSLSSQFLTGLLMAYAAADAQHATINVIDLKSKPYVDLTLKVMKDFHLNVPENNNYESFEFKAQTEANTSTVNYTVEGDWSGGAFLLVAGAIAGNIIVKGLDINSTQADKAILGALVECGCKLSIQADQIEIGPAPLKAFQFDATDCPDLFPPLVALASYCNGKTVIEGVHRLTHKESNRALTLQDEFGKMGVQIDLQDNIMVVQGGNGVKGATVHSRHDHRIAMACAVAALKATGGTTIEEAGAVSKSYPNFYEHIQSIGAVCSVVG